MAVSLDDMMVEINRLAGQDRGSSGGGISFSGPQKICGQGDQYAGLFDAQGRSTPFTLLQSCMIDLYVIK